MIRFSNRSERSYGKRFAEAIFWDESAAMNFMVFMKDITEKELAARKAEELKEKLLEIDFPELKGRKITASMGIAFFPDAGESYKEV